MTPAEDTEAYLVAFERAAEANHWPANTWLVHRGPFFAGKAQSAYAAVISADPHTTNYGLVKEAIFRRYKVIAGQRISFLSQWASSSAVVWSMTCVNSRQAAPSE